MNLKWRKVIVIGFRGRGRWRMLKIMKEKERMTR